MYNLKIKIYDNNTIQITHYKSCIVQDGDIEKNNTVPPRELTDEEKEILFFLSPSEQISLDDILAKSVEPEKILTDENLARSMRRTKNMIVDYGRNNIWDYFCTFTFDKDLVDRENYASCSSKIRKWFNNQLRSNPDMKYLLVPEEHKKGGWHFHALVSNVTWKLEKAINPHTNKPIKANGKQVYNIGNYRFGFSTLTRVTDTKKTVSYIVKYITKDLCKTTFGKQRYFVSQNLSLPISHYLYVTPFEVEDFIKEYAESNGFTVTFRKKIEISTGTYGNTISYIEME